MSRINVLSSLASYVSVDDKSPRVLVGSCHKKRVETSEESPQFFPQEYLNLLLDGGKVCQEIG